MSTEPTAHRTASDRPPPPWRAEWIAAPGLSGARRVAAGLIALALLALALAAAIASEAPPAARPADAPEREFSADRAWPHLERIAGGGPTPIGSPGNAEVRDYLVGELRGLGLDAEVQTGIGARAFGSGITAGIADNITATIPGTDSTGTVLLAAHYDSTSTTPGASDDKASVAAILEIARAITGGPAPRNDIVLLLTDGEEPGLIGAEAFAAHHPDAEGGGFMVNLEGPGNAGASHVYNTSDGNGPVTGLLAAATPHPAGESALLTAFRDAPIGGFNSDRTTMSENGFTGVDTGFVDGRVYYHHPGDTVEAFNRPSLQMHGANGLSLTRAAADADLAALRPGADATFFTLFGTMVHYPNALVWPLAAAGALAVAGLAALVRVRRLASVPRLLAAVAAVALPLVAAAGLAIGLWEALLLLRPAYADLVTDTYRPLLYRCALGVGLLGVLWAWFVLLRRWVGAVALTVGALAWAAALGLLLAWALPSGSYLFALPALIGAGAGAAALALRDRRPPAAVAVLTVGALAGVLLPALPGRTLLSMAGISLAPPAAVVLMLAGLALLPVLSVATPAPGSRLRTGLAPVTCAVLAAALAAGGLAVDRFDAAHPRLAHLAYLLDADTGTAFWASANERPHPWAGRLAPDPAGPETAGLPIPVGEAVQRTGAAPAADLAAPQAEVLDTAESGGRTTVTVRVRPQRGAHQVGLYSSVPVRSAAVAVAGLPGQRLPRVDPAEARAADGPWAWSVQFYAPRKGDLRFTVAVEGDRAPRIGVSETTLGMADLPGYRPRPPGLAVMPSTGALPSDTVTVSRTLEP
ncbi:peptidase M28-like protein [Murinocardiopsis flavida]|uniref:Peptidase M28-like protein n=1 Tax=Murinocardiopsis flavida TaxID=645275 RepID=A0A2P8DFC1_9ACTN|nr:M28 family peptidase [Murinocardiopsis flavida]PSK95914.1 peptidase M28-like protein [Murinocardiopsis flavida]